MSNNIQEKIQEELQAARNACDTSGASSSECAAAWDAVEELQAEASHQRTGGPKKTSLVIGAHFTVVNGSNPIGVRDFAFFHRAIDDPVVADFHAAGDCTFQIS